ncbi:hypothetical protein WG68_08635 [Arsukibacterium ikkense]|uniref:Uncharacterized protein n=1 Tax=Arsukibacterium ikkense TaxID=336831 RepID=A0A0M2V4J9_9GAMM|nr:hypothetical protein [Arsukibacterium ikkense]KKO45772.1 hypothetical protein WG68_08635 [Arsukibacterium ikkense]
MREKLYANLCTGVSLAINVIFSIVMGYLLKNEPDADTALGFLMYTSIGSSLLILGYAGYAYYHPAKKPHSVKSSLVYTVCFGAVWILQVLFKQR